MYNEYNGWGRIWENDGIYSGIFKNNKKNGFGTKVMRSGNTFRG
jgi:hypothetical protein